MLTGPLLGPVEFPTTSLRNSFGGPRGGEGFFTDTFCYPSRKLGFGVPFFGCFLPPNGKKNRWGRASFLGRPLRKSRNTIWGPRGTDPRPGRWEKRMGAEQKIRGRGQKLFGVATTWGRFSLGDSGLLFPGLWATVVFFPAGGTKTGRHGPCLIKFLFFFFFGGQLHNSSPDKRAWAFGGTFGWPKTRARVAPVEVVGFRRLGIVFGKNDAFGKNTGSFFSWRFFALPTFNKLNPLRHGGGWPGKKKKKKTCQGRVFVPLERDVFGGGGWIVFRGI